MTDVLCVCARCVMTCVMCVWQTRDYRCVVCVMTDVLCVCQVCYDRCVVCVAGVPAGV